MEEDSTFKDAHFEPVISPTVMRTLLQPEQSMRASPRSEQIPGIDDCDLAHLEMEVCLPDISDVMDLDGESITDNMEVEFFPTLMEIVPTNDMEI